MSAEMMLLAIVAGVAVAAGLGAWIYSTFLHVKEKHRREELAPPGAAAAEHALSRAQVSLSTERGAASRRPAAARHGAANRAACATARPTQPLHARRAHLAA
ncbi:MAG: hypothetical protein JWN73_4328 [Betaproteobacteria bacterium]|nr:hypothetical protein [Betaproteobacteria bacterium]